jgi:hypothetical protein
MHGSGRPSGKEEEIMDWREPADMKGITIQRWRSTVKEQWDSRMLGCERSDMVLVSRLTLSKSARD